MIIFVEARKAWLDINKYGDIAELEGFAILHEYFKTTPVKGTLPNTSAVACRQVQQEDEYVCVTKGCGLRWDARETKPPCRLSNKVQP